MEEDFKATNKCNLKYGQEFDVMYVRWAVQKENRYLLNDINYGYVQQFCNC